MPGLLSFFEKRSHYIALASLKLPETHLPLSPEGWDCGCGSHCLSVKGMLLFKRNNVDEHFLLNSFILV